MCYVLDLIREKQKSEKGFVFIVALIAVIVLIAIGFFALTMISEDLMISSRMVAERKAFSAAEAGAHAVFASIDLKNPFALNTQKPVQVDPVNDPTLAYLAQVVNTERQIVFPYENLNSASLVYEALITGRDTAYNSEVKLSIGMAPPPSQADTQQGEL
jgi:hypothetical protein